MTHRCEGGCLAVGSLVFPKKRKIYVACLNIYFIAAVGKQ